MTERILRASRTLTGASRTSSALQPSPTADNLVSRHSDGWRDEVADRVQAHRARRRRRFDPDASLNLTFQTQESSASDDGQVALDSLLSPHQATQCVLTKPEGGAVQAASELDPPPVTEGPYRRILVKASTSVEFASGNLIEFPRLSAAEQSLLEELAEPIIPTPRILYSPENEMTEAESSSVGATTHEDLETELQATLPSMLASIHLDENLEDTSWLYAQTPEDQMELPLQVAPLGSRVMCMLTDAVVVLTAAALFCVIVLSIAKFVPQGRSAAAIAIALPLLLWTAYHYLFLRFSGTTPGMQMAQLELSSFEGCVPTRTTRTWRALSMLLSCVSLGLGFAWAMVDEDSLSWHDRITRTYLRQS